MKKQYLRFLILFVCVGIVLFANWTVYKYRESKFLHFLQSKIVSIKLLEPNYSTTFQNDKLESYFITLLEKSVSTKNDLYRGEASKFVIMEMINDKDVIYKINITYSESSNLFRVIIYDIKSNAIQYNYLKDEYFEEFIKLINQKISLSHKNLLFKIS